jgi:hypothetical protein
MIWNLTPLRERVPITHRIRSWVEHKAGLDTAQNRIILVHIPVFSKLEN